MKRYMITRKARDGSTYYLSTLYSANRFDWTAKSAFAHRFVSTNLANKWLNKLIPMYPDSKVEIIESP